MTESEPLIPDRAAEDRDELWGEHRGASSDENDDWLQEQRPPHWQ